MLLNRSVAKSLGYRVAVVEVTIDVISRSCRFLRVIVVVVVVVCVYIVQVLRRPSSSLSQIL